MHTPIKILLVEDSPQDAEILMVHLKKNGFDVRHEIVDTPRELSNALTREWDTVICDYNLPGFSALDAISLVKSANPDIPTIVVSGSVGEEIAVKTIKAGATDYIMKDNLLRLVPAIERGLKERHFQMESRQIESSLRKVEEELRQAQKLEAIGQLAGGIAHDFNNIIATVLMQVEELQEDMESFNEEKIPHLKVGLNQIKNAGERAKNLTRQLLGFSRKQIMLPKVLNLNSLISSMEEMLRPIVEESIEFRNSFEPNIKNIKVDPGHMEQIIINLVVNARDAMPRGGILEMRTSNAKVTHAMARRYNVPEGEYALLEICDNGIGISPEAQRRLFEPFFTTKPLGKGTGLGLCTVYGIVKQNQGLIFVESEVGKGTKFQIYLPQVDEAPETQKAQESVGMNLRGSETVLFVEDEDSLKEIVSKILRRNGYNVLTAGNGFEALEIIKNSKDPIDLVITDVVMPQMGGAELAAECQKLNKNTRFLFQSGYTEDTLILNGVRSGLIHFLQKPYDNKTLLAKIRAVINRSQ